MPHPPGGPSPFQAPIAPRRAAPGEWLPPPSPTPSGPDPAKTAAAIAAGVLALWTPFTAIYALILTTQTDCTDKTTAAICRPPGHLTASFAGPAASLLGLTLLIAGSYLHRRSHAVYALVALATAAIGFVVTLALATNAPTTWTP